MGGQQILVCEPQKRFFVGLIRVKKQTFLDGQIFYAKKWPKLLTIKRRGHRFLLKSSHNVWIFWHSFGGFPYNERISFPEASFFISV